MDRCPEANKATLRKMMDNTTKPMGLIVHERLANVPTVCVLLGPLLNLLSHHTHAL
jgi:hypothetical protein